jgi:hypothetical protein
MYNIFVEIVHHIVWAKHGNHFLQKMLYSFYAENVHYIVWAKHGHQI